MKRGKILGWAFALGFLFMLPMFFMKTGDGELGDLRKAVHVVRHTAARRQVQRSSYMLLQGQRNPTHFVKWMFSPLGTAEWFVTEDMTEFSAEEIKMVQKVSPIIPRNVSIVPYAVNPDRKRQVVVKPDDVKNQVIAEAYADPQSPPVFVERFNFPKLD
jgi:hypothetical protein